MARKRPGWRRRGKKKSRLFLGVEQGTVARLRAATGPG
jgi:hypothetical protein